MPMPLEVRSVCRVPELRAVGEASRVVGYGAVFNQETIIADFFREVIVPGAFASAIANDADVRALFNHDENYVLGRTSAGTMAVREDETGLWYEVTINRQDPEAVAVAAKVERRDVTGSSIGFRVKREEWIKPGMPTELPLRRILEFDLLRDVGPVTFPAFEETTAEARSAAAAAQTVAIAPPAPTSTGLDPEADRLLQLLALDAVDG